MSRSISAALSGASMSARGGGAPKTHPKLREAETSASGAALPAPPSGAARHGVHDGRPLAVPGASQAGSTTAVEESTGSALRPLAAPEAAVLTVDELAALLRLNRKTVYDALSRGEIPGARRVGSTYRILRAAVIDWLASGQGRVSHSKRLK